MEIESATQEKAGPLAIAWDWVKALPLNFKNIAVNLVRTTKKLGQDDPRRVMHSLKVGLALTLVSLLYYWRPLYNGFGVSGMWAVLTVVVVFEFTVGATLSKGLNRACATLSAGALGCGAHHLARLFGEKGEPIVLAFLVFLLAAASSFTRFIPRIKARYDYGVLIFILTFSLVSVTGYRVDKILELANERLSTIGIGGATCIIVSIFVCPVWAGEDLHKLIAFNIEKLASYLEGFGGEYFADPEDHEGNVMASKGDKALLQGYKSVLNSKNTEESLANFARWEPGHGRFHFCHPWKQYLKIGVLARQCAYRIDALNGYFNSDLQAAMEFRNKIRKPSKKMCSEASKALKALALSIKTMTDPSTAKSHVENSKTAIDELKLVLKAVSLENADLLAIVPIASVASILTEITKCVENIYESVHELSCLAEFKSTSVESTVSPEKPQAQLLVLHCGSIKPVLDGDNDHVIITVHVTNEEYSLQTEFPQLPKPGQS
ncbi:aluminum-activated malate transporter 8 [Quercus lobata]|uniref:Aluminum activated malate transporter family protein n=1 Tax=Quercus lobata TaxID=97700 RepID=A0A7N2R7Z8_QUELO|nr:aluminum-activated malate transporter 8 [Quercus lobata]